MSKEATRATGHNTTLLHDLEVIEGFVRESGLEGEANELHAISERLRVALVQVDGATSRPISIEEARRVLEEIRRERAGEGPRQDIQRALA